MDLEAFFEMRCMKTRLTSFAFCWNTGNLFVGTWMTSSIGEVLDWEALMLKWSVMRRASYVVRRTSCIICHPSSIIRRWWGLQLTFWMLRWWQISKNNFHMFTLQGWRNDWNWRRAKHSSPSGCKKRLSWDHRSLRRTRQRSKVQPQDQTLEADNRVWRGARRQRRSLQTTTKGYLRGKIFAAIENTIIFIWESAWIE